MPPVPVANGAALVALYWGSGKPEVPAVRVVMFDAGVVVELPKMEVVELPKGRAVELSGVDAPVVKGTPVLSGMLSVPKGPVVMPPGPMPMPPVPVAKPVPVGPPMYEPLPVIGKGAVVGRWWWW